MATLEKALQALDPWLEALPSTRRGDSVATPSPGSSPSGPSEEPHGPDLQRRSTATDDPLSFHGPNGFASGR